MQVREKVGKSRVTMFFQWFGAPEGRKVTSLKRRVRSQLARWEIKNCTPLWREAHFQVKMYKARQRRTTFGSWDVERCTPLWREAHFQIKMYKAHQLRTTFGSWDVEKVDADLARSTFPSQNVQDKGFGPLLEVEMSKKCTPLWRETHDLFWHWDVEKSRHWLTNTNLTNLTHLTNLTNTTNLTDKLASLPTDKLTNVTNLMNLNN